MLQPSPIFASPTVRIQQSTPTPQDQNQQMLAHQSPFMGGSWNDYNNHTYLLPNSFKDQRIHKRGSSGSSVASAGGPPSPLNQNTIYPLIATSDSYPTYNTDYDFQTPQTAKSLPSAQDMSNMYPRPHQYSAVDMRRIHSSGADERANYTISAPQSVSTMSHNSPATPHTNYETEYDDSKNVYGYPTAAFQQSLQDVFPDQQFSGYHHQAVQRLTPQSHRQNMMTDRLQAASNDHLRTSSPTSNPRDKSPFRQNSPYSIPIHQQRQQQAPPVLQKTRTSISPKELMLDEHDIDENSTPLFHDQSQQMFAQRQSSNLSNFYAPQFQHEPSMQIPQQYPFVSQQSRGESQSGLPRLDSTPDFPAHMISMESTAEEGPSMPSSQQSVHESKAQPHQPPRAIQRPMDTSSDAGTYSCTYHNCSLRFDSPSKLQKHKREGHRQVSPNTSGSASPNLALRNSQAGPHRCDRINPQTGKSCNSIFSRPYDLTRHEDTIHNGRKIKVKCHLCTEDKTFSRNDALTRHMRVVHPDVDWVGKQKRKSHK